MSSKIAIVGWVPGVIDNVDAYLPEVKAPERYKDQGAIDRFIAAGKAKQRDEASEQLVTGAVKEFVVAELDTITGVLEPVKLTGHVLGYLMRCSTVAGWRIHTFANLMFVDSCRQGVCEPAHFWARSKPSQNYKQMLTHENTPFGPDLVDPIEVLGDRACRDDLNLFIQVWGVPANWLAKESPYQANTAIGNAQLAAYALGKIFTRTAPKA